MTKRQIMVEVQEWLTSPNRAIELYKRGELTFEVDATSKEDLDRFQSVLMPIPDSKLLALVKLEGHSPPVCMAISDLKESRDEFEELRARLIERELQNKIKFTS